MVTQTLDEALAAERNLKEKHYTEFKCGMCDAVTSRKNEKIFELKSAHWYPEPLSYQSDDTSVCMRRGLYSKRLVTKDDIEIDLCPDCFEFKLVPWLESQGVEIRRNKIEL